MFLFWPNDQINDAIGKWDLSAAVTKQEEESTPSGMERYPQYTTK